MPNPQPISWESAQTFLAVVEHGSFSRAALALGLGQPTVSRRVAQLESLLTEQLFRRGKQGAEPTAAAHKLIPAAEQMAKWASEFVRTAQGSEPEVAGVVTIAAPPGVAVEQLAPFAAQLRAKHPDIRLEVLSAVAHLDLNRGGADIAIRTQAPTDPGLTAVLRAESLAERLSLHTDGRIRLRLKRPFRDGTTHLLFTPADFIARLAALIPRPRRNLTRYHGVFAPSAPLRRLVVPTPTSGRKRQRPKDSKTASAKQPVKPTQAPRAQTYPPTAPLTWAQRLKRVFDIDITLCPLCGGQLRVIADITEPALITKILDHVQNRDPPRLSPRHAPGRALPHPEPNDLFAER